MKLIAGKHELDIKYVNGMSNFFQNANRDTFEIYIKKENYSMDQLYEIFSNPSNLETITLIDDELNTYNHYGYVKLGSIMCEKVPVDPQKEDMEVTFEERIIVKLYQLTPAEKYFAKIQSQLDDIILSSTEG